MGDQVVANAFAVQPAADEVAAPVSGEVDGADHDVRLRSPARSLTPTGLGQEIRDLLDRAFAQC
jgi:hypothetical protein